MRQYLLLLLTTLLLLATAQLGIASARHRGKADPRTPSTIALDATGALNWKTTARLKHSISKTSGTLAVDSQGISFQPDRGNALRWSFQEVESLRIGPKMVTVKTYEPRGWHEPGTREMRFKLETDVPTAIAAELAQRVQRPSRNGVPEEKHAGLASLPAHHRASWGGGSNGVLRFDEGGIDYVSGAAKDSRSWRWADIQTITSTDPFHLIVFGYLETYSFDLKQPLQQKIYDRLTDELYRHHDELRNSPATGN